MYPRCARAWSDCEKTSKPATVARPEVGGMKPARIRMVVVLPAPFGPRNPRISPRLTRNEIWSTAVRLPYTFVRFCTSITACSFCSVYRADVENLLYSKPLRESATFGSKAKHPTLDRP